MYLTEEKKKEIEEKKKLSTEEEAKELQQKKLEKYRKGNPLWEKGLLTYFLTFPKKN